MTIEQKQIEDAGAELSAELKAMLDNTEQAVADQVAKLQAQVDELGDKGLKIEAVEEMLAKREARKTQDWNFAGNLNKQDAEELFCYVTGQIEATLNGAGVKTSANPLFANNKANYAQLEALYSGATGGDAGDIMRTKYFDMISDLVVRYGSRGHDFFDALNLDRLTNRNNGPRRVILESTGTISLLTLARYSNLTIETFEEAAAKKITVGFDTPTLKTNFFRRD